MHYRMGEIDLFLLRTGRFRLDGGAMFGVVPKPIWQGLAPPDERNRIELGLNCVLVRSPGRDILIDTGIGDKWDEKNRDIYGIDTAPGVAGALVALGIDRRQIDLVVLTHLHFDHAGGSTMRLPDGTLRPTFPEARYVVQRGNVLDEALSPNELRRASYLPENFAPLIEENVLHMIEGDVAVADGVSVIVTGGHQRYHQAVVVESGGERAIFLGDIVPTAAHVNPPYIMAYDHYPLDTLASKKKLLGRAADERWLVVLEHEPHVPVGRVARDGPKFRWEPMEGQAA